MMKKFVQITATKEGRKMAKEAFRKLFKKHKAEVARTKKTKGAVPTVPYDLKKADLKKQIKGTRLTVKADIKAQPGLKRRIVTRIERAKREKSKFKGPVIFGKAYASDKAGKTMQVPLVSKLDRRKIQRDISESVRRFMRKKNVKGFKKGGTKNGYRKGGDVAALKNVATKLRKASKAHAGQSKVLRRIVSKYV
tara:strand:- start:3156 stop:3737 length:582 start_codon:yes stop_codon:yes gene_type:complete